PGNVLGPAEPGGGSRLGSALLTGLLRCHRCGRMLRVFYKAANGQFVRYACTRAALDNKEARCIAFSGASIDGAVAAEIVRVLQPAAIEAAVLAHRQQASEREQVLNALQQQ